MSEKKEGQNRQQLRDADIKNGSIYLFKKKNLVIIHREKKTDDDLGRFLNVFLTKTYGRSKILFASFSTQ